MAITRWDPLRELRGLQEQMNRLLEQGRACADDASPEAGPWQPPADIYEDEHAVVLKLELPEIDQREIEVRIEEQLLVVTGERRLEYEEQRHNYQRIERSHGPFRRTFALPATVDLEQIRASCERGVLRVVLPKTRPQQPRQIEIEVK